VPVGDHSRPADHCRDDKRSARAGPVKKWNVLAVRPVPRKATPSGAGRSSDFRTQHVRPSRRLQQTQARKTRGRVTGQQWPKRLDAPFRSVTAAGPFRIRTGFPVRRPDSRPGRPPAHADLAVS